LCKIVNASTSIKDVSVSLQAAEMGRKPHAAGNKKAPGNEKAGRARQKETRPTPLERCVFNRTKLSGSKAFLVDNRALIAIKLVLKGLQINPVFPASVGLEVEAGCS
jgi:hypothetical protein